MQIITGDALEVLKTIPDACCSTCVTSPPYYGLRNYGEEGQIGLEETPGEYIERLVEVFREVRRVLKNDGTLWLNIGDSYANDGKWGGSSGGKHAKALHGKTGVGRRKKHTGEELPDAELGDALIVLPSHVGSLNGIAAVESTTVRISGEAVMELANELRKHRGHDITMEAGA